MKGIEDYLSGIIQDMQDEIDLLEHQNKRYRELLKNVFNTLDDYLHVITNESDLIDSAEHLSRQIYEALEDD